MCRQKPPAQAVNPHFFSFRATIQKKKKISEQLQDTPATSQKRKHAAVAAEAAESVSAGHRSSGAAEVEERETAECEERLQCAESKPAPGRIASNQGSLQSIRDKGYHEKCQV